MCSSGCREKERYEGEVGERLMIGFSKNGNNDIRETIGAALSNFHTMLRAKDIQQVVNKN